LPSQSKGLVKDFRFRGVFLSERSKYRPSKDMRTVIHALAIIASILAAQIALGQDTPANVIVPGRATPQTATTLTLGEPAQPKPQRFDLDFRGGNPKALVAAIEKATGKPLNAIIQGQEGAVYIPAMKLTNVTVRELFEALSMASMEKEVPGNQYSPHHYCFQTTGQGEDAVWCFHVAWPQFADVCRYFQLADYLDNFTIEDITTAIQTGWDLLGVQSKPRLKYHPETKLLIAVGQPDQLRSIDNVLEQLRIAPPKKAVAAAGDKPAPARTPKKDGTSNN
jgi:hypothetical protein